MPASKATWKVWIKPMAYILWGCPVSLYAQQKEQNAFRAHWPWFVSVFSWLVNKKCGQSIVFPAYCQEKPCGSLEVDSETQAKENILKNKKGGGFCHQQSPDEGWFRVRWLWAANEPKYRQVLALSISWEGNSFVTDRFIAGLVRVCGKHTVSTDGAK